MSEMIERVAAHLAGADGARLKYMGEYRNLARAAIRAMREPTRKMVDAPLDAEVKVGCDQYDDYVSSWAAGHTWEAMIDAALSEGE